MHKADRGMQLKITADERNDWGVAVAAKPLRDFSFFSPSGFRGQRG